MKKQDTENVSVSKNLLSDTEIVQSVLDGNVDDFATLIVRYEEKLRRYIMRISKISKEDADDILQDIFIKVYYNLADFDTNMSFSAWVYRIARNETISRYRKDSVRLHGNSVHIDDEILKNLMKDDSDVIDKILEEEVREKIEEAVNNLDSKYKDVIILRYFEDKDYLEIADILQIPTGTVSTLLHRAKKKLKEELKAYE